MAVTLIIVLVGISIALMAFFYFIRHWPLKVVEQNVFCPVQQKSARVSVVHSQVSFGSYMPSDVSSCSLFSQGPVSCDKQCMK